jgi:hypothetical protein
MKDSFRNLTLLPGLFTELFEGSWIAVNLSMSVRTASDPSKAQGFSLHSLIAGFPVIFVVVFPSNPWEIQSSTAVPKETRMSIPFGRDSISHSISLPSLKESRSLWTSLLPLSQMKKKGGRGPLDGSDSPKRDRSQHPPVRSQTHLHPPFMDWRGQAPMSGAGDGSLV